MPKARGNKKNALKHGIYSRQTMLPGEKISEYQALSRAYHEEWAPDGVTEHCLVDELVMLRWRKLRLESYDQIRLQQRVTQAHVENEANRHGHIVKKFAADFNEATTVEAVEQIFSKLAPLYAEVIRGWVPREKCKDPTSWGKAIGAFLSDLKPQILQESGLFAASVNPDLMEMEVSRSVRLDEAIDRKIKQLVQVKTAKQMFWSMRKNTIREPKLISPPREVDQQPANLAEAEQIPATPAEVVVIPLSGFEGLSGRQHRSEPEETLVIEGGSGLLTPNTVEEECSIGVHVEVGILPKPDVIDLDKERAISAFYSRYSEQHGWAAEGLAGALCLHLADEALGPPTVFRLGLDDPAPQAAEG